MADHYRGVHYRCSLPNRLCTVSGTGFVQGSTAPSILPPVLRAIHAFLFLRFCRQNTKVSKIALLKEYIVKSVRTNYIWSKTPIGTLFDELQRSYILFTKQHL